jgi:HAE1 family hydrophobic/amphiphilic exporter-1
MIFFDKMMTNSHNANFGRARRVAAVVVVFFVGARSFAADVPLVLTLDEAVRMGLERNVDVELARRDLAIFESRYRQAFGAALPALTLSGGYTRNFLEPLAFFGGQKILAGQPNALQAEAQVDQALYSGGKVSAALRGGAAARKQSELDLQQRRDDAALQVKTLFYSVLLASATASIERDNLASAAEHLRTIEQRYKSGLDSDLAVLRQQVEVANAKPALIRASNQVELGLTLLKETLSLDVDLPVTVAGDLAAPRAAVPSYERAVELAMSRRPEVLASHQAALVAQETTRVVAADGKPQLSAFWNYMWQGQGPNLNFGPQERGYSSAAGVNLRFPVFSGGQVHYRVAQSELAYEKALAQEGRIRRAVRVDVKRQWLGVREALERAQSQETAIDQARRALESVETRYKAGQAGQLDLTDATLALNRARTTYVQALNDYWVGLAALSRAAGADLKEIMP